MVDTLDVFQKAHYGDAVRPNLFYVYVNFPSFIINSGGAFSNREQSKWLVQSASLPGRSIGIMEIPFRGLKTKYAGNTIYPDWAASFLQDVNFQLNNAFEGWLEYIESPVAGIRANDLTYKTSVEIIQLDGRQNVIKNYVLIGAFPNDKADIPLSQDANDEPQIFEITFSYDYYVTSVSL
jgi:hypothetical protein